ncbi:hypothetical protein [Velocimicrobium porci]|uniref:Uncharacterized protein n=1 Tax=Velocimicrobium porci TaxID=2606634 RepID=A0A6L5Y2A6_9FIRM|nr:hypothetical protein [Velocimicrobium porci]MSS65054.1 hypothetical protein [Velocimicrobium porci]
MIDQKGLEERLITSLELIEEEHPMKELQLKDTVQAIRTFGVKEKFPFLFPKKPFFFLIILLILFIVGAVLPSPKKLEAIKNHKIEEQAKQEIKKVEKAYEKVEKVKHLDKELEKQFKKLLEQGKKELKKANSKEEIKKSMDRLKTKIRQELQQLEAGQELEDVMEATFSLPKPDENDKKGEKKESGTGNGKDGQKEGKLNGTKSSNSKGKGNGASQGKNGLGGKKNYGSKNGIEQENTKKENPEKITIPGKKKGKDENLTGKATKGESKQSKGGIGYGYRGESVDYNQVVGEYKQEAYEKLEKNQIPSDMKGVVKEYFDYLETGKKR